MKVSKCHETEFFCLVGNVKPHIFLKALIKQDVVVPQCIGFVLQVNNKSCLKQFTQEA